MIVRHRKVTLPPIKQTSANVGYSGINIQRFYAKFLHTNGGVVSLEACTACQSRFQTVQVFFEKMLCKASFWV